MIYILPISQATLSRNLFDIISLNFSEFSFPMVHSAEVNVLKSDNQFHKVKSYDDFGFLITFEFFSCIHNKYMFHKYLWN